MTKTLNNETEILQIRNDTIFHDVFNGEDMNTLEWMVMHILGCSYEEVHGKVTIGNIRLTRVSKKDKNKYLDLIVEYNDEKVILELNNNFHGVYTRNIIYAATVLINNYKINDDKSLDDDYYKNVVKVLLINLNWYPSKKKGKKTPGKTIYEIPYAEFNKNDYLLKIINVNLDYFDKLCYDDVSESDKLYKLLTIKSKKELMEIRKKEKLLEYYSDKLIDLSSDEKYKEVIMDKRVEKNIEKQTAYLVGKNDGIEQGIEKSKKEMAINLFNRNVSLDIISESSGLTIEEVKKLINSN